jgi:hypothetical protein
MEQMATPRSILIAEYTRKLTEGYFDLKAIGAAVTEGGTLARGGLRTLPTLPFFARL